MKIKYTTKPLLVAKGPTSWISYKEVKAFKDMKKYAELKLWEAIFNEKEGRNT